MRSESSASIASRRVIRALLIFDMDPPGITRPCKYHSVMPDNAAQVLRQRMSASRSLTWTPIEIANKNTDKMHKTTILWDCLRKPPPTPVGQTLAQLGFHGLQMKPTDSIAGKLLLPKASTFSTTSTNVAVELKDSPAKWRHKSITCCLFGNIRGQEALLQEKEICSKGA